MNAGTGLEWYVAVASFRSALDDFAGDLAVELVHGFPDAIFQNHLDCANCVVEDDVQLLQLHLAHGREQVIGAAGLDLAAGYGGRLADPAARLANTAVMIAA